MPRDKLAEHSSSFHFAYETLDGGSWQEATSQRLLPSVGPHRHPVLVTCCMMRLLRPSTMSAECGMMMDVDACRVLAYGLSSYSAAMRH